MELIIECLTNRLTAKHTSFSASVRQLGNTKLTQIRVSIVSVASSAGGAGARWFARSWRVLGAAECEFAGAHCCRRQLVGATHVATFHFFSVPTASAECVLSWGQEANWRRVAL